MRGITSFFVFIGSRCMHVCVYLPKVIKFKCNGRFYYLFTQCVRKVWKHPNNNVIDVWKSYEIILVFDERCFGDIFQTLIAYIRNLTQTRFLKKYL